MSIDSLKREEKIFLVGYLIIMCIGLVFRFIIAPLFGGVFDEQTIAESTFDPLRLYWIRPHDANQISILEGISAFLYAASKFIFMFLVIRFSRILKQNLFVTIIYSLLALMSVLFVIPFLGLLISCSNKRKQIASQE